MAQNVTIPGGTNRSGHASNQGVTKPPAVSSKSSARVQDHGSTVKFVDGRQTKQS